MLELYFICLTSDDVGFVLILLLLTEKRFSSPSRQVGDDDISYSTHFIDTTCFPIKTLNVLY